MGSGGLHLNGVNSSAYDSVGTIEYPTDRL